MSRDIPGVTCIAINACWFSNNSMTYLINDKSPNAFQSLLPGGSPLSDSIHSSLLNELVDEVTLGIFPSFDRFSEGVQKLS